MTGVSECSQQRGSLKDDGYRNRILFHLGFSKYDDDAQLCLVIKQASSSYLMSFYSP
ncbi:hypothetical protein [Photorhabdus bodei]|uniref:Uncharacterized protein n=1 Tax=Photorhabdus bodei TaxID=2029681 RepID=A0ABX0AGM5_9GAMM|nr:hypothetical protein [Photorhabdus bodei]NDK97885.1 hypothetical protein [Photorhabdus bodei]NDL02135.1 hypothetical protein [Photorhabdus bodei]NDL06209.1 hypothetical protein [Photorhabdus bodei]